MLTNLGRLGKAKAELEDCLALFAGNPAWQANALSSLAAAFHRQGDPGQAIAQQRRALALRDQLPEPADRALSHNNLAAYLEASDPTAALAEAPGHRLAALEQWLRQRGLDPAALQADIDAFLDQAREAASGAAD